MKKANVIYPCKRIGFSMRAAIAAHFTKTGQDGFDKIENVVFYLKLLKTDTSHRMQAAFVKDFEALAERHIIQKDNQPYFEQVNVLFQKAIKDTALLKKVVEIRWSYLGKAAILKGEMDKGGDYFAKAMLLNPTNIQYSGIVAAAFGEKMDQEMKTTSKPDTLQQQLDAFLKQYPQLATHSMIQRYKALC